MNGIQSTSSPSSSPSLTPDAGSASAGRKRQRSHSMESAASSSSPKRSASEDAQALDRDVTQLTLPGPSTPDIDTYMATQEDDPPLDHTTDLSATPTLSKSAQTVSAPSTHSDPQDRLTAIEEAKNRPLLVGETWYLVSRTWYRRWHKAVSGVMDKEGPVIESDLGPVDNSSLVNSKGDLSVSTVSGIDVEYLPQDAWDLLVTWYGQPQYVLPRRVIPRGMSKEAAIELFPPRFRVYRLSDDTSNFAPASTNSPELYSESSEAQLVEHLLPTLALTADPSTSAEYRVWKVQLSEPEDGSEFLKRKFVELGAELVEPSDKTLSDALIDSEHSFVVEFKRYGSWIVDVPPAKALHGNEADTSSSTYIPPAPLFGQNGFFDRMEQSRPPSLNASGVPSSSALLRPAGFTPNLRKKPGQTPGTLGLGNMGNTCFMNSALQCLAHLQELTEYFLYGVFKDELNPDNPLGMHGEIAESFGALLHRIWSASSASTSYSPREFKSALQRFAPQFSGYQQHDSQELVAFLLDGLHEDLNRVIKKPYVEKPDWEGGGDKEVMALARESWEGYMKRNDSVIVDLFQGQYKSTLVCPECEKVSITFDPFMYLTLPLPVQKKWTHTIRYIPWDVKKPHVRVPVEINRDASFKDLRHLIGRWMGSEPDNLLSVELFAHKFYRTLGDAVPCGDVSDNDDIAFFELPCHAQQARTYASKKTDSDPFLIPVLMCDAPSTSRSSYNFNRNNLFGQPFVVAISREDARSVKRMREIVTQQLERWSSHPAELWSWRLPSDVTMEEVHIPAVPVSDAPVTEFKENGDVVTVDGEAAPAVSLESQSPAVIVEEGDIVDERAAVLRADEEDTAMLDQMDVEPVRVGPKDGVFAFKLQAGYKDFGTGITYGMAAKYEEWEDRIEEKRKEKKLEGASEEEVENLILLQEGDAFFLEFDENMKDFYFSAEMIKPGKQMNWRVYTHPEYEAARQATSEKTEKGISLQDCLDEFTREEKLGEEDPWYCPRCKKHQQATKKFDLWRVPDVLVVHLKRFSNSRALRDKIEAFVDFPVNGLDLTEMAEERRVGKKLAEDGSLVDPSAFGLEDLDEPLVYDLFAVDEHLGGLGGGHYRAYAQNHVSGDWYHFDDSYVTRAEPHAAVNPNAYLLFYKRRTTRPLGRKTHEKVEEARAKLASSEIDGPSLDSDSRPDYGLPTPPSEPSNSQSQSRGESSFSVTSIDPRRTNLNSWQTVRSPSSSNSTSPPPLEDSVNDSELPAFEDSFQDELLESQPLDPLAITNHQFDFPAPSSTKASPTSSNEVELDSDEGDPGGTMKRWVEDNGGPIEMNNWALPYSMPDSPATGTATDGMDTTTSMSSPPGSSLAEFEDSMTGDEGKLAEDGAAMPWPAKPTVIDLR